jgi:hypothetical protein
MRSRVVSMLVSVRLGGVDLQQRREIFVAHYGRLYLEWHLAHSQCIKEDLRWFGRKQRLLAGL